MDTLMNWYQAVADCEQRGEPYVLVTVLGVTGSVPREPASKMVVTGDHSFEFERSVSRLMEMQSRDYLDQVAEEL